MHGQGFGKWQLYRVHRALRLNLKHRGNCRLPARRIVRILDELIEIRGRPAGLRMDNGSELISEEREKWARRHGIERRFVKPGKPMQNGLIECFNRTDCEEVLDSLVF